MREKRSFLSSSAFVLLAITTLATAGCGRSQSPQAPREARSLAGLERRTDKSEALLGAAVAQLRDLPSYVNTELRPAVVILDSTKSREARQGGEGQDILATLSRAPDMPEGLVNYLMVPAGNALFRLNGVRSGDVVKYYVRLDEESLEAGFTEVEAVELTVAQVLDENTLLVQGSASQPITVPAKIEVWRYVDDRLEDIGRQLGRYVMRRLPPIGWEPSPDQQVLAHIVEWLNQWVRQSQPNTDWEIDPLLATLGDLFTRDETLATYISAQSLGQPYFQPYDGRRLQEAVWLRDIARWAHGETFDDVARATALFDWTVRNIQLDADAAPRQPWEVLLYGCGTAEQRAWVFALLCRQQDMDVVILELPAAGEEPTSENSGRFWLPALLSGDELYLFDTRLGLPIPGPGGAGVATLRGVLADDGLLRQLDLPDIPYPVAAGQLQGSTANVVADWFDLSRRARLLETRLSGDDRLALTAGARDLVNRLEPLADIVDVRLWRAPYRTLQQKLNFDRDARRQAALEFEPFTQRPVLWKARVQHFRGQKRSPDDATDEVIDDHRLATQAYTSPSVRPPDRMLHRLTSSAQRHIFERVKLDATYWVGLLLFDDGKFDAAEDWLGRAELQADGGRWTNGAHYNLARTYEAAGKLPEAIALYRQDTSPQRPGNLLRAHALEARANAEKNSAEPDRSTSTEQGG